MQKNDNLQALLNHLRQEPAGSKTLAAKLGCDRSTVSRLIAQCQDRIISTGRARATLYYLCRHTDNSETSLYCITETGNARHFARMIAVMPHGYLVKRNSDEDFIYYDDLPWWLQDMRPQGFLGRALAKHLYHNKIVSSADPDSWSDNDVFNALRLSQHDAPGNLLVGEQSYQQWLLHTPTVITVDDFAMLAEQAISGEIPGSSAGGEQPKFCVVVNDRHLLVKFSAATRNANSQRWADLLQAECLALNILQQHQIAAGPCEIITDQHRTYLSYQRFDRIGLSGRRGVVSLRMAEMEFVGHPAEWPVIAHRLYQQQLISEHDYHTIAVIWCYGRLLANTDMHTGNLSFFYEGGHNLQLAPVYDMLPMAFAPDRSGAMTSSYPLNISPVADAVFWKQAYPLAHQFWQQLSQHPAISAEFRQIAGNMLQQFPAAQAMINRMA
ncbi:type II toxin-antitoxin system HipA family toxin YjjJ [Chromatiaceae bacterium AAb-1]|nr:type II toxin-antitoxin system HipA family toxin YjjJ [Chromatiaceae bacterium AAb-1]